MKQQFHKTLEKLFCQDNSEFWALKTGFVLKRTASLGEKWPKINGLLNG